MAKKARKIDDIFVAMTMAEDMECVPARKILRDFEKELENTMSDAAFAEGGELVIPEGFGKKKKSSLMTGEN